MRKILLLLTAFVFSLTFYGQGKSSGKAKDKQKDKTEQGNGKDEKLKNEIDDHNWKVWQGTYEKGNGPKPSKNQPAKVREAFQRDYPNARNVYWSKYRGDWTASFGNGLFRSTAVYHANGDRRDTRTPITRNELPRIILDSIFKKRPDSRFEDIIKVEIPKVVKDIFRIKDIIQGKPVYLYFDADGNSVEYNY